MTPAGPTKTTRSPRPFRSSSGPARPDSAGFVLGALRSTKGQAHALLALLPADAASGKIVDLGAVHGDPDPPQFALHGADAILAASDTDAAGGVLKLGLLRDLRGAARISWGPEITGVRRDSTFALEVSGDRGLLAYAAEVAGKIRVFGVLVDPASLKNKLSPEPLSAPGADVQIRRASRSARAAIGWPWHARSTRQRRKKSGRMTQAASSPTKIRCSTSAPAGSSSASSTRRANQCPPR